jgi:site-specific DNA-methyltransferase (adenine-specific)
MAECADKQFELCIVDPPYGIGQPKQSDLKGYNGRPSLAVRLQKNRLNQGAGKLKDRILNNSNCEWDNNIPDDNYFEELFRITQNQIIWGGNYFPLPPTRGMLCWDKVQPWENFSQIELAWTSFDVPAKLFKFDNRTGGKIHPTEKPIPLYKYCLQNYAKPGWTIFDSHGGSLSIAIACHDLGFELVACECDLDYLTAAVNRIKNYLKQPKWFKPVTTTPTQGRLWRDE